MSWPVGGDAVDVPGPGGGGLAATTPPGDGTMAEAPGSGGPAAAVRPPRAGLAVASCVTSAAASVLALLTLSLLAGGGLAVIALLIWIPLGLIGIVGVVLGILALVRIRAAGPGALGGRALAVTGIVVGAGLMLLLTVTAVLMIAIFALSAG